MPMRRAGIYQVINTVNGAGYVGSARDVRFRCQLHRSQLHRGNHSNRAIKRDIREFGPGVFRFRIIELVDELHLLRFKEAEWIRWMQADGPGADYNLKIGLKMQPESRYLIAERVLLEKGRFCLLPEVARDDPVSGEFLRTWSPNHKLGRDG
ncbi:MAG: GIY-YIG nuclease family protein [Burkholderiaceae bacterium]|nr:GIY-YIG nuclease family protein [Burkholderiaceae bacterium]